MSRVIGVQFKDKEKAFYLEPDDLMLSHGDQVIVETSRGIEMGKIISGPQDVNTGRFTMPLKDIIRPANEEDRQHAFDNEEKEKEAFIICQKKIVEHGLDMKLIHVQYYFDNSKIQFSFTSGGRVDFRMLVKDLASIFKMRIDLRQIGVRDEAKMLGGLGPCGRTICCGSFLDDFQPVSIKMAKEQNLSLNPTKLSGVCGRLMCCLKYEQEQYECMRRKMPKPGTEVNTPDGKGIVWEINIVKETIKVKIHHGDSGDIKEYPFETIGCQCPVKADKDSNQTINENLSEVTNKHPLEPSPDTTWKKAVDLALQAIENDRDYKAENEHTE